MSSTALRFETRSTRRLRLLRPSQDDFAELCRMHRDERVMATLGGVRDEAETAELLRQAIAHWREHGWGWWSLRDPETRSFVGRGGLRRLEVAGRAEVEVAYALLPGFWGRGLASELARESAAVAFDELGLREIVALALPHNRASRRVMEKTRFCFERDVDHAGLEHVLYRLTAEHWRALP